MTVPISAWLIDADTEHQRASIGPAWPRYAGAAQPLVTMIDHNNAVYAAVMAERDCRTCAHWTDTMQCSSPSRCFAGAAYKRQGIVQLWKPAPVDVG